MEAVNAATQMIADMFMKRAAELPFDQHPYHGLLKARGWFNKEAWDDAMRQQAVEALDVWCMNTLGGAVVSVMNEIVALMRIADAGDQSAKDAMSNMAESMPFLEKVMNVFVNSVNMEHVAEMLFADGQRREAVENGTTQEKPDASAKKPIQNWTYSRWAPSAN
jgi:hypothetical protein